MKSTLPLKHLFSLFMFGVLISINSCKKEPSFQIETVQVSDPGLLQQAKDWYQQQLNLSESTTGETLDLKVYTPDWSKAKVIKNSRGQKVIGVALFRSKQEYVELNVQLIHGKPFGILKKYVLDEDKKIQLTIYNGPGELIKQGYYDEQRRLLISGGVPGVKLMGVGDAEDPIELAEVVISINLYEDCSYPMFFFNDNQLPFSMDYGFNGDNGYNSGGDPNYSGGGWQPEPVDPAAAFLNKIDDTNLSPCMKAILANIKNLSNGSVATIIQKFNGSTSGWDWKIQNGNIVGNAGTAWPPNNYTVTTTIDNAYISSATDLSLARTLLHESVHAYLVYYFRYDSGAASLTYPDLVSKFFKAKTGNQINDYQHNIMANNFVNDIADALHEYAINKGYTINDSNYFKDMAWAALEGTKAYQNLPYQDRQRINDRLNAEKSNSTINGIQPKGQKGC